MSLIEGNKRRLGRVRFRDRNFELVAECMKGAFMYEASYKYESRCFEYVCLHPDFDLVDDTLEAPIYYSVFQHTRYVLTKEQPTSVWISVAKETVGIMVKQAQEKHPRSEIRLQWID